MKIGIFTDSYLPTPTGVAISVETFRKALTERGHQIFIFAPHFPHYKDKIKDVYRFPSFRWPARPEAPVTYPIPFKPWGLIESLELDIIHTQHFFTLGKLGLQAGRRLNIPVVHTYHTYYEQYAKAYAWPMFKNLVSWWLVMRSKKYSNKCDQIIVPSPSMERVILKYGIKTPIEPIPTPIHPQDFISMNPQLLKKRFHIPQDHKVLLHVGRLGDEKNIRWLLKTFQLILTKFKKVHLLLVGGGPDEETYRNIVKQANLTSRVTFTGFLSKGEVNKIFGACDVFVFASLTETQGIVVIEAMAAGTPVVAVDYMGPSDILRDGEDGYLVPLNQHIFTKKVIELLENDKFRHIIGGHARRNAERFSLPNVVTHLESIYQKLVYGKVQDRYQKIPRLYS